MIPRFHIIAVGRFRRGPDADLFSRYAERLGASLQLREVEDRRAGAGQPLMAREAALLRAAVPADAVLVALDERGADLASTALAAQIAVWRDAGRRDIAFLIGGADGLDPALRKQAALTLAFGRATWPHKLARVMLAEQLYRCRQILEGHPYHRE